MAEGLGHFSQACVDAHEMLELSDEQREMMLGLEGGMFHGIGNVHIGGVPISAGLKRRAPGPFTRQRWASEAFVLDHVLGFDSSLVTNVPSFTLPVVLVDRVSDSSSPIRGFGLLTEDYTEGGAYSLLEYNNHNLHSGAMMVRRENIQSDLERAVFDAFDGRVRKESFSHMAGCVRGREVMVDYDNITYPSASDLLPYEQLADDLVVELQEQY